MPIGPRSKASLLAAALAMGLAILAPSAAWACGGLFCQNQPVDQAGERILFATDGENVTAHVQIQYQGPAKDFSWIVPVPTPPKLAIGSDLLFRRLRAATRPNFRLELKEEGCEYMMLEESMDGASIVNNAGGMMPAAPGAVTVVSEEQVGPFQSAVIQSNDPGALKTWLRDNGYTLPQAIDPLMDPYVAGKYYFLALKLRKDRDAGDLAPISFTYKSTKPGIPIRLTGVAATPDMGVWVWVLGNARAVPENYRHAEINEARIDWLGGGQNYPQVVTEAMNEAGGQAFVTDFAGKSDVVPAADFDAAKFDLARVRQATRPADFARAVLEGGFFGERNTSLDSAALVAFLKRFVPKPKSQAAMPDDQFFQSIESYGEEFDAEQISVDAAAGAAALEEQVVKPLGDIKAMLEKHPYLTSLYTTMSPDEMTQDPMFVFNGQLPAVANAHVAQGLRRCEKDQMPWTAPVFITLGNGISFWARDTVDGEVGKPIAMPAALRIEQLKAAGAASLIQDNANVVRLALGQPAVAAQSPTPTAAATAKPTAAPTAPPAGQAVAIDPSGKAVAVPAIAPKTTRSGGTDAAAGGFGCAGCANPAKSASRGVGEGLTFALFALGLVGWRLRAGRRR